MDAAKVQILGVAITAAGYGIPVIVYTQAHCRSQRKA